MSRSLRWGKPVVTLLFLASALGWSYGALRTALEQAWWTSLGAACCAVLALCFLPLARRYLSLLQR
ncbi:hypothetical protein [Nocardiopsis synnemataformans]|uniref:hypothetical protein n=1 Tax=Nocardiopsis synnemataformans TaxID=61305 RepID=UPI003EB8681D